jgi:hypothetical protein
MIPVPEEHFGRRGSFFGAVATNGTTNRDNHICKVVQDFGEQITLWTLLNSVLTCEVEQNHRKQTSVIEIGFNIVKSSRAGLSDGCRVQGRN